VGLALSDEGGRFAMPFDVVEVTAPDNEETFNAINTVSAGLLIEPALQQGVKCELSRAGNREPQEEDAREHEAGADDEQSIDGAQHHGHRCRRHENEKRQLELLRQKMMNDKATTGNRKNDSKWSGLNAVKPDDQHQKPQLGCGQTKAQPINSLFQRRPRSQNRNLYALRLINGTCRSGPFLRGSCLLHGYFPHSLVNSLSETRSSRVGTVVE
jgi:hypothetical protein